MGLFKRKINKNAANRPRFARDYGSSSASIIQKDGTAFSCMDRIASEFASLNYAIYDKRTRQKVTKNNLYNVLKEPNLDERHFNFFYQSAIDYFNGGVFWLVRRYEGEVISLFRLNPANVQITRDANTNRRKFLYNGSEFTSRDIVYIPSRFDYSTLTGGSSIFNAIPNVFKTSNTLEQFTQATYRNGIFGKRLVIDVTNTYPDLTAKQAEDIKNDFQREYAGVENASRPLLQFGKIEYKDSVGGASIDNTSAQLAENRNIQEREITKAFGVPIELLNGLSANSNLENIFVLFNEFALRPMATQFQEAISSLLDEDKYYFEFDYNGVMKVSLGQRIDAYAKQINNGLMSPNEARQKENLPPIEAGDNHFMPVNLMPLNDETISAYMAKQKNEINGNNDNNPTDPDAQHFGGGDDKQ